MAHLQKSESPGLRVLIIDDEPGIVDFLTLGLGYEGFCAESVGDGRAGLQRALADPPDIVVLDLMLPGLDGLELCRRLRQQSGVPVIMLTARDDVDDRVRGLNLGADDYLTKPFEFKELVARIRAVLRRPREAAGHAGALPPQLSKVLHVQDVTLDPASREVRRGGRSIALTMREYELLELLMRHPNQVLTRETILDRVWGYEFAGDGNVIEVYVRYLRQKLGKPNPIDTVRGVGYVMKRHGEEAQP